MSNVIKNLKKVFFFDGVIDSRSSSDSKISESTTGRSYQRATVVIMNVIGSVLKNPLIWAQDAIVQMRFRTMVRYLVFFRSWGVLQRKREDGIDF